MPMQMMLKLSPLVVAVALATAPCLAYAEPPPTPKTDPSAEDLDRAKELFENGKGLFSEGSYDAAIAAFKQAYANSGDPVLLYNIALAYDRSNNFDGALEYLEYYRAYAPESERQQLSEKEESLRKRQLRAQSEQEAEPVDEEPEEQPTEGPEESDGSVAIGTDSPTDSGSDQRIFTLPVGILLGVTAVGLGVGTGLGVAAVNRRSDADEGCGANDICSEGSRSDVDASRRLAIGADVAFAVGATAGVVAIALIIRNAVKRKKSSQTASVVPMRGGASLAVRF